MSTPDLTPILEELAAGRIDAAEAARRIDALKEAAPGPGPESQPQPQPLIDTGAETKTTGVERVSLKAVGRKVVITGDTSVATASVDGQHVLRRNGNVLEISSESEPGSDGFSIFRPPLNLDEWRSLALGKELRVRMNPRVWLDVEVTGGVLTCADVKNLGKVRLTAGSAEITGFKEANDVLIQAGSANLRGRITNGQSRVRCETGQVTVALEEDSNVLIHAEAQLGAINWNPAQGEVDEVVLGNGTARLDIGVVMGWAQLKLEEKL
ncbi:MAG: hypothetical protein LBR58_10170 [Propionibacteriaceae bacterium]|jgi:hypothetical protein|nr:hypothetical protein [Propionibacteriaceae bacterium]